MTTTESLQNDRRIGDDSPGMGSDGRRLVQLIRRGKWLIALALIAAGGLGYLYYAQSEPIYASGSQVLLIKRSEQTPFSGSQGNFNFEDTLSTHMLLLQSPLVIGDAVRTGKLDQLESLSGHPDPVSAVIRGLAAEKASMGNGETDPNVVDLRYSGSDPADCRIVLEAVLASYQRFLGEKYRDAGVESVELIAKAKDDLSRQLHEKEQAYAEFRREAPLTWGREGVFNVHQGRMHEIEQARAAALMSRADLVGRIKTLELALTEDGGREAALAVSGLTDDTIDPHKLLRERLFDAELEAEQAARGKGERHPDVKAIHAKAQRLREELERRTKDDTKADPVAVALETLRRELHSTDVRREELDARFEVEREMSRSLASAQLENDMYQRDIDRTQRTFDAVLEALQKLNLVNNYGGVNTQVIKPPADGVQIAPRISQILTASLVLGLFAGLVLCYLQSLLDRRFRDLEDLESELRLPVIGMIPRIEEAGRAGKGPLALDLCTHHRPNSPATEAYRGVRTSMFFGTRHDDRHVIQVTSPLQGDGKSTAAANLAVCIGLAGKRVLLIDADFHRPRVHTLFGMPRTPGLGEVLLDGRPLEEAVHACPVENLSLMPCGSPLDDPAERLMSFEFERLLETVGREYDYVIVDSPPLLAVTDPAILAPRMDGVLLVLNPGDITRAAAARARDILAGLETNVLGIMLNAVSDDSAWNHYGYGYGYGYGERCSDYTRTDTKKSPERTERTPAASSW